MFKKTYIQSIDIPRIFRSQKIYICIQDTDTDGGKNASRDALYTGKMQFFKRGKTMKFAAEIMHKYKIEEL